jgi:hypothetical protein
MVVGTPGYMSPEQAEGAQAGPASDVFSLGCVLAYAATGNAPFGGGSAASVLYRVVTAQPDLTGLTGPLRDVISACLSKDPAQRPGLPAVGAMITQAGPAMTATPTSFWPDSVAGVIQAAAAYPTPTQVSAPPAGQAPAGLGRPAMAQPGAKSGVAQDGYHAMATASMSVPRPARPPGSGAVPPAQGVSGLPTDLAAARSQPVTWPQTAPAMSRYAPAPLRPQPPAPVLAAAWLMYSGAAFSLLSTLVSLATVGEVKTAFTARHPLLSGKAANSLAAVASLEVLVGGGAVVALWLWLAFASKQGRSWARTAGTVLFGVDTLALLLTLGSPGIGGIKGIGVVIWLIGLVTVILLWRRQSSEYFALRR